MTNRVLAVTPDAHLSLSVNALGLVLTYPDEDGSLSIHAALSREDATALHSGLSEWLRDEDEPQVAVIYGG